MKIDIRLAGDAALRTELKRLERAYPEETARSLYQEGYAVHAKAIPLTPKEFGPLRNTSGVAPPTIDAAGNIEVVVYYGTAYAVYVHERLDLHHPIGQAKFLKVAFDERMQGFFQRLALRIQQNIERGVRSTPIPASPLEGAGVISGVPGLV